DAFRRTVQIAVEGARTGQLMTIGITPTRPETGYGYLECSDELRPFTAQPVLTFREKPPAEVADEYVKSGRYLWNAGMFVWRARTFLTELARHRPDVATPIDQITAAWDSEQRETVLQQFWRAVPKIAVE